MDTKSQRPKPRDGALSSLNVAIEALGLAKEISCITPAKAVFGSVIVLLTMIRDSVTNEVDYVDLGLACADVCRALDRGVDGRRVDELNQSVFAAIWQLTTSVAEIQKNIVKRGKRSAVSRLFHAKDDKEAIAAWRLELSRILHVFNTELAINTHVVVSDIRHDVVNTHTIVSDVHQDVVNTNAIVSELQRDVTNTHAIVSEIRRNMSTGQEGAGGQHHSTQASIPPGELPPPPPRACFGRDDLIEKIVGLAKNLTPLALIGTGGIGKTSIALSVLHHDHIKQRFGDNRRFIRCDQFPASRAHFLNRLSKVIGAGVENPEDLTSLRPFLSSRSMILFLDNAESVLDFQGKNSEEIYAMVEELSQFDSICLCITSRVSTIPPYCKHLDIPTLSMDAARHTFYRIYDGDDKSDLVNGILEQLDFHPLSITLLATVARHNKWSIDRLTAEWERQRTGVLHVQHNRSLAATIELSLASPMFQELGPDAHSLLGAVAFFPQGVDEKNLEWLFPDISDRTNIFDKFCILSLTYRSNGFITMLAPLRDYLCPKDPMSSPLLCAIKDYHSCKLSVDVYPGKPGYEEARWITSEDMNVEHLLDVFTSTDTNSAGVWDACAYFMGHLYWHKPRPVLLGPKIEELPDDHRSKPQCLYQLSLLFDSVGNYAEEKRVLVLALKLWRERGDDFRAAQTLMHLSDANRLLGLYKEGIPQAKEALEICERLNNVSGQAQSLEFLARLLCGSGQLDAAEEATTRAIELFPDEGEEFRVCRCHRVLGDIHHSKGETEKAIDHFETALGIASTFNWHDQQFWILRSLAQLFFAQGRFDDAHTHIELAKSNAAYDPYYMGRATSLQARFWYQEHRFEEAKSEALCAAEVYEKLGAVKDLEACRELLRDIETEMEKQGNSSKSYFDVLGVGYYLANLSKRILLRTTDRASGGRAPHS